MGMGMSDTAFFIIVSAAIFPLTLVIAVPVLAGFYYIRRPEVGPELARQEIKKTAILISILLPSVYIFALLIALFFINTSDKETIENIFLVILGLLSIFLIAYPLYWWRKFEAAKKSELFQVPIKASQLILVIGIAWVFLGIVRFVVFFVGHSPFELILGLCQIMLGLYFVAMWFFPTWHITKEGIYSTLGSIKWGMIFEPEWQPKNDKEVLFRCKAKRWWLPFKMPMTQTIPIEYERPLKSTIQKYTNQETPTDNNGSPIVEPIDND